MALDQSRPPPPPLMPAPLKGINCPSQECRAAHFPVPAQKAKATAILAATGKD